MTKEYRNYGKKTAAALTVALLLGAIVYLGEGAPWRGGGEKLFVTSEELPLIYKADLGFVHTQGQSPCPQPAGAISVGTEARTRLKLVSLRVSGEIAPLVHVEPLAPKAEGARITIVARFGCVADKGTYRGTLTAVLREPESGREATVNVPMQGIVQ